MQVREPIIWYTTDGKEEVPGTSAVSFRQSRYFPPTVRRPKPDDLFASATPRETVQTVETYPYWTSRPSYSGPIPGRESGVKAPSSYWFSGLYGVYTPTSGDLARLDNKLRLKIKDEKVNLAVMSSEFGQAVTMTADLARNVSDAWAGLVDGDAKKRRSLLRRIKHPANRADRALASKWLELQYGWLPLMSDVHGAAESAARGLRDEGVFQLTSASTSWRVAHTGPSTTIASFETYSDVTLRALARYKVRNAKVKLLSELGFLNPLSYIWERIPYSFVVDWVVPVGDYLAGLDALAGTSELLVQRSYQVKTILLATPIPPVLSGPTAKVEQVKRVRIGLSSDLSFGAPRLAPSINTTRLLNATALLRGLFKAA